MILSSFYDDVITPEVKNISCHLHDVNNYCHVSIIAIVASVFECVVNIRFRCMFTSQDNQLGFTADVIKLCLPTTI